MTQIVIVAGGLATRMRPITEKIPKCLIDIYGTPLIERQLNFFRRTGYKDIIFCVAHLSEKVKDHFGDGSRFGMNIQYVKEKDELMGTAGSVKLVEPLIHDNFFVYYGDNLTNMDFDKFMKFHKSNRGTATLAVRPLPEGYKSSSVITLYPDKKVKVFLEKPPKNEIEKYKDQKRYINNGIYAFSLDVFDDIPENQKYDFSQQLFPKLREKDMLYAYPTNGFFREIGRVEKYKRFLEEFKGKEKIL